LVEHGGGLPYGDFEGTVSYQEMGRRRLWKRVSLCRGPFGEPEVEGVRLMGT